MDINKLTQSEKIIAGSGIGLLIFSFFPWYGVDAGIADYSRNGWDYFLFGTLPVIIGAAMVAHIALTRFSETKLPEKIGNLGWGQVHLIAGCVAGALVLLKLAIGDDVFGYDLDRKFGIFLSAVAGVGLAAGGFLKMKEAEGAGTPPAA